MASSKRKLDEYEDMVSKRFKAFSAYRDEAVQKWDDKTRLASRKVGSKTAFEGFEQSALRMIGQIMTDKERLLKRTQLKRSTYSVIGQRPKLSVETSASTEEQPGNGRVQEYDEEIFDDDDFYHQLLRELIEQKTAATSDPIALSRQWMELQKLRTKVKKNVDTKASKGRKVRYDTHPKLVNFMAPIDKAEAWEDEQRDELFSSLLGQRYEVVRNVT